MNGYDIAKEYSKGNVIGWSEAKNPGLVKAAFNLLGYRFSSPNIFSQYDRVKGAKTMLYQVTRKVLGHDTPNYAQEIGDCVSFGMKNAVEYLTCCDKLMKGQRDKYRPLFTPYYYGTGRVYVGGWDNDYSDGSLGSYMAEAVQKYGSVFLDMEGCPKYSGNVAKEFGAKRSLLDKWKPTAISYVVKKASLIKSWEDLVVSITNGGPVTTASSIGYAMEASSDGFFRQTDEWNHQMCIIGVDDNDKDPYAIILNSWGDVHGRLKDFETGEDLPVGVLRVRRKDIEKHIRAQETYSILDFEGDVERRIDKSLFKLI